jgi:hypothetical protein
MEIKQSQKKFLGPRGMFLLIIVILFIWFEVNSFSDKYSVIMKRKISKSKIDSNVMQKQILPDKDEFSVYLSLKLDDLDRNRSVNTKRDNAESAEPVENQ